MNLTSLVVTKAQSFSHPFNHLAHKCRSNGISAALRLNLILAAAYLLLFGIATKAQAEDSSLVELPSTPDAYQEEYILGERHDTIGWLIDQRNAWSHQVENLGRSLDGFFAGEEAQRAANGSYLKVGLRTVLEKAGENKIDPRFRLKVDLPSTEKKFKLVFESDPDEGKSLEQQNRERNLPASEQQKSTSVGAISYVMDSLENWTLSNDIGVKLRIPPNPFWRARAAREWELSERWRFNFDQRVYYFMDDGLGETTSIYFDRPLTHTTLFRSKSEAQWSNDDNRFEFAQVFSILQRIDMFRAAEWRVGALGENRPTPRTTAYFTNVTYRRLLYKDWLFYEMTPELLFPRSDHFEANPSLSISLEVIFSE